MSEVALRPEPWGLHLLGLISPILAIAGNLLGGVYTISGVVFIWVVGPILDVVLGESKNPRPPRNSGAPFEALLWVHGLLHFVMLGTLFVFAASLPRGAAALCI